MAFGRIGKIYQWINGGYKEWGFTYNGTGQRKKFRGGADWGLYKQVEDLKAEMESLRSELSRKMDADRVTQSTSITQAGYAVDARQLNAAMDGTVAASVSKLEDRLGKIVFGTYCPDPGGKDFADIPVKPAEVRDGMILAVNGDSVVWRGAITGFNFYFENVRCTLSEARTGFIRINYVYVHV